MPTLNVTIRRSEEIDEAERIAKENGAKTSYVIRLGLQHGLPIAKAKLATLRPPVVRKTK